MGRTPLLGPKSRRIQVIGLARVAVYWHVRRFDINMDQIHAVCGVQLRRHRGDDVHRLAWRRWALPLHQLPHIPAAHETASPKQR